jgi:rare lipoprotein A
VGDRLIDVSEQAAEVLAFRRSGTTRVRVQYVGQAPRNSDDTASLLATYRGPTLPVSDVMAFTSTEPALPETSAAAAVGAIASRASANKRILAAFEVAAAE